MGEYYLRIGISFEKRETAAIVLKAIEPELNAGHAKRSRTSVKIKNSGILINIKALDAAALRAAANSVLHSIALSKSMVEV